MPFPWKDDGVPYLGITIIPCIPSIIPKKIKSLHSKILSELNQISKYNISWFGRIAATKMFIIPQILYLFWSLLLPIAKHHLHLLMKTIKLYTWKGKRAHCSHSTLSQSTWSGGAGFPDIVKYYWATQMDQLKHWLLRTETPRWVDLEMAMLGNKDLFSLLLADMWRGITLRPLPPTTRASLLAWRHFWAHATAQSMSCPILRKIDIFQHLIPNLSITSIRNWGIEHLEDILLDNVPMTLEAITSKYALPPQDQNHMYETHGIPTHNLHTDLWTFLTSKQPKRKTISLLYNILNGKFPLY